MVPSYAGQLEEVLYGYAVLRFQIADTEVVAVCLDGIVDDDPNRGPLPACQGIDNRYNLIDIAVCPQAKEHRRQGSRLLWHRLAVHQRDGADVEVFRNAGQLGKALLQARAQLLVVEDARQHAEHVVL